MSYNYEQDQFIEYHHQVGDYPTVTPSSATGTTCGGGGDGDIHPALQEYKGGKTPALGDTSCPPKNNSENQISQLH